MLTVVKNQFRITILSTKYAIMREMLNKATFLSNIIFMILNNSTMLVQWFVLFSLKEEFGGYTIKKLILLWGLFSLIYGVSHFFFKRSFNLSDTINSGKLDAYLVQPKNVLIASITSDVEASAIGDILYGYILLFVYGLTPLNFFYSHFLEY